MQEVRYTIETYQLGYDRDIQNKKQNDLKAAKGEGVRKIPDRYWSGNFACFIISFYHPNTPIKEMNKNSLK